MVTGLICGLLIGLGIGVPISAIVFRAAVSAVNRMLGPQDGNRQSTDVFADGGSLAPRDESNPYSAPTDRSVAVSRQSVAIVEPDFGRACMIVFVAMLFSFVLNFFIGIVFGAAGGPQLVLTLLSFVVGFAVTAKVYQSMLPTTFGRASLVYVVQVLISIAIGIVIFGVIFAVGAILG